MTWEPGTLDDNFGKQELDVVNSEEFYSVFSGNM